MELRDKFIKLKVKVSFWTEYAFDPTVSFPAPLSMKSCHSPNLKPIFKVRLQGDISGLNFAEKTGYGAKR